MVSSVSGIAIAQPAPAAGKGRLVVREKSGKPIRVVVDGVDMGDAPWSGDVDVGSHEVSGRGQGTTAAGQKVSVAADRPTEVELVASSSNAPVKIGTADGKGLIYIDDKLVGEGSYVGDLPAGPHKLKVTREGYDPFEETIQVKENEPLARTVTLKLGSKIETGQLQDVEILQGLYGGFGFLAMFTPGGTGNSVEKLCDEKEKTPTLAGCETPDGFGGGFGGFIGYHWDPVGIELYLAGQYDQRVMTTDWNAASTDPGFGPDPPRTEEYTLRRIGGLGMLRVRTTYQTPKLRLTVAAGVGLTRRVLLLERVTNAKDASGQRDVFVSEAAGYWSPIVGFEPSVMYRVTRGVAVGGGLQVFFDAANTALAGNDGNNPQSNRENLHTLGGRGLTTNPLDLASNLQIYIGPFIGMMFGP